MVVFGYFYCLVLLFYTYAAEVSILYLGRNAINESDNSSIIKVIEGSDMILECISDENGVTFQWLRNEIILTMNSKLELHRVSVEDEGYYTCSVFYGNGSLIDFKTDRQFVLINVLYPPWKPVIKIPDSVLLDEVLTLSCLTKSDPESTYQWRQYDPDGLLLSRNMTYQLTVTYPSNRIYCVLQNLMIPTFSDPKRSYVYTYVHLNVHVKAYTYNIYPARYVYLIEGGDLYLRCEGRGEPAPKVWWTKIGDEGFHMIGNRVNLYKIGMSDAGDYVCNVANTVIPANGTKLDVHRTKVFHVFVQAVNKISSQSPHLSCSDCFTRCTSNPIFQPTSPSITNMTYPVEAITTGNTYVKSKNCTSEQVRNIYYVDDSKAENSSTHLVLIIVSVTGWTLTFIMLFLIVYIFRKRKESQESDNMRSAQNTVVSQNSYQTTDAVSAYVSGVRILDGHYTDLTTYDQISSASIHRSGHERGDNLSDLNDNESVSTQTSIVTYMEPVTNQLYAS